MGAGIGGTIKLPGSAGRAFANAAGGIAASAAQSLITGKDFGDTLMANLPGIVGNTVGSLVADGIGGNGIAPRFTRRGAGGALGMVGAAALSELPGPDEIVVYGRRQKGLFEGIHKDLRGIDLFFGRLFGGGSSGRSIDPEAKHRAERFAAYNWPVAQQYHRTEIGRPGYQPSVSDEQIWANAMRQARSQVNREVGGFFAITAGGAGVAALAGPSLTTFALTNAARISTGTGIAGDIITGVPLTVPLATGTGVAVVRATNSADFVGPLIGKSGFRTSGEFAEAVGTRYQGFVDDAYIAAQRLEAKGLLRGNANTRIGDYVDRVSANRLGAYLRSEGISEGPGSLVQMNRWLRDPSGSGLYVRPDVRIPAAGRIYDATVGFKAYDDTQIVRFGQYSGGDRITIVRPSPLGSYSIVP